MTHDSRPTPWTADESLNRTALDASVSSDVCVVGAGVAGLSTAYLLQRDGRSVVVVDSGTIAGGQTGRTTAHLASALDDRFVELERLHGAEGARGAAASHAAAIDRIETIVHEEGLDCGFARVDGYLFDPGARAPGSDERLLRDEHDAAHRAGLEVELVARAPIASFDTGRCLRFARQARVEPLRYLDGLARAFERRGGRIFTGTRAAQIVGGSSAHVDTVAGHRVSAAALVVATNSPINDLFALHAKQAPYTSYAIAARVPRGAVPDVLLWDTEDPYHYVRLQPGGGAHHDLLIIGGEDHKTGHANDGAERFARLEVWARDRFPAIASVEHRWSGQVLETSDGLAFIGRNPGDDDNVYVASGDSGHGMTHGTIAGILVCDLVAGRASPWRALYDPARIRLGAAGDLVRENLDVARTWDCPCHGSRFDCAGRVVNGPANRDLAEAD